MDFWERNRTSFLAEQRMTFGISRPTAHAKLTGLDVSKRAVRDAMARLEEMNPDKAALLREHIDCGRSTDPRWSDGR